MKKLVYIDVDGTLVDHNDNVRPHIPELIDGLTELGCTIIIWSAGGEEYAESKWNMICNQIFKETDETYHKKVDTFMWKHKAYNWKDALLIGERCYIDDHQELIHSMAEKGHGGFLLTFYNKDTSTDDTELLEALGFCKTFFI